MSKTKNIILSICIPTYNRLLHIKRQVQFLVSENLEGCEVIISCNPAEKNDETSNYLKSLKYEWLRININDENIGAMNNMKKCVDLSNGKYVWLLGDDDYIKKNTISKIVSILNTASPSMFHMNYYNYDEKEMIVVPKPCIKMKSKVSYSNKEITRKLGYDFAGCLFISSNIFAKEIIVDSLPSEFDDMITAHRLILSMKNGNCFFDNEITVLSGVDISWKDKQNEILFKEIPDFLSYEGFHKARKIYLGIYLLGFMKRNKLRFPCYVKDSFILILPYLLNGIIKKIKFILSRKRKVNLNDFYIKMEEK